jgi:hypothetical protein
MYLHRGRNTSTFYQLLIQDGGDITNCSIRKVFH